MRRPAALGEVLDLLRLHLVGAGFGTDATVQVAPTEDELPTPPADTYLTVVVGPAEHQQALTTDQGQGDPLVLDGTLAVILWHRQETDEGRDTSDWTDSAVGAVDLLGRLVAELHNLDPTDHRGDQVLMESLTLLRVEAPPARHPSPWKPYVTRWLYRLAWEL